MTDEIPVDDVVHEAALQLWAASQTDFDPYQVPPEEWRTPVPVRDIDIAFDTGLDVEAVRESLRRLDGSKLVVGHDAGNVSVLSLVTDGSAP